MEALVHRLRSLDRLYLMLAAVAVDHRAVQQELAPTVVAMAQPPLPLVAMALLTWAEAAEVVDGMEAQAATVVTVDQVWSYSNIQILSPLLTLTQD